MNFCSYISDWKSLHLLYAAGCWLIAICAYVVIKFDAVMYSPYCFGLAY